MTTVEFLKELGEINDQQTSPYFMEICKLHAIRHFANKYLAIMEDTSIFSQAVEVLKSANVKTVEEVVKVLNDNQHLNAVKAFTDNYAPTSSTGLFEEIADATKLTIPQITVVFLQFHLLSRESGTYPLIQSLKMGIACAYCKALNIPSLLDEIDTDEKLLVKATEETLDYKPIDSSSKEEKILNLLTRILK